MISSRTFLNCIATEACQTHNEIIPKKKRIAKGIKYNLRLVKKKDGTFEWKD